MITYAYDYKHAAMGTWYKARSKKNVLLLQRLSWKQTEYSRLLLGSPKPPKKGSLKHVSWKRTDNHEMQLNILKTKTNLYYHVGDVKM